MAIATVRRESESNERLISRWKKKTQQAGIIQTFRDIKHFKKKPNRTKERDSAIVREKFRAERRKKSFYS